MKANERGQYSAAPSALGYIYQVRYPLLKSLLPLRKIEQFVVYTETLDDVVFETGGEAPELLQTKYIINRAADLTDSSTDLWKTLRIWCSNRNDVDSLINEKIKLRSKNDILKERR